jgi:hypothetical protein
LFSWRLHRKNQKPRHRRVYASEPLNHLSAFFHSLYEVLKRRFHDRSKAAWGMDLGVAFLLCILWLWFGYQFGFRNSPDSWYRGLLAKSIAEGHPYFVNVKQGYIYEFGAFHHDVTHPPFIPLLMAPLFLVFGAKILFANLISCVSAALLVLPLVRISRVLCKTPMIGYLVYFFLVFNEKSGFLFETLNGLSIPTTMLLLCSFFYCYLLTWKTNSQVYPVLGGLFLACAGLTRFDAESVGLLLVLLHLAAALWFWRTGNRKATRKIILLAGTFFLVLSPWIARNLIYFHDPLFNHGSPTMWTNDGLEYWKYHEELPLPSPKVYFERYGLADFVQRAQNGLSEVYRLIDTVLPLPFWLICLALSILYLLISCKRRKDFVFYLTALVVVVGYLVPFALVSYLAERYMIPLILMTGLITFTAFYRLTSRFFGNYYLERVPFSISSKGISLGKIAKPLVFVVLTLVVYKTQQDFWKGNYRTYLPGSYGTGDRMLMQDPLIEVVKRELTSDDVILGPMGGVQYLNFATGLTFVETPSNLGDLDDPYELFRKYRINYSLLDLTNILPNEYIEDVRTFGNIKLSRIKLDGNGLPDTTGTRLNLESNAEVVESIRRGKAEKTVFIDTSHGSLPFDFKPLLRSWGYRPFSPEVGFQGNPQKLFRSGVLMISYKQKGGELTAEEVQTLEKFVKAGGSVLLLCPAWVWTSYDNKPQELNPHFKIAKLFNLTLTDEYQKGHAHLTNSAFTSGLTITLDDKWGTFSRITSTNPTSISLIEDEAKNSLGVAAVVDDSRIIVIGQNFLSQPDLYKQSEGLKSYTSRLLDWLLEN